MKILMAVDGSVFTKRMLAWLAVHPELIGADAEYVFITVTPTLTPHVARYLDKVMETSYYDEQASSVLNPITAFASQHGWKVSTLSPMGRPAEEIAKAAKLGNFDMIMMGSHGHSPIGDLVLGSVAQRVLSSCSTPVLIVR